MFDNIPHYVYWFLMLAVVVAIIIIVVVIVLNTNSKGGEQASKQGMMVHSIELQDVPPHDSLPSAGGDGIMNINEIQLWRLNSEGTLTNVARDGTASLVQGHADKYFAYLGGIDTVNNDKSSVPAGFQFTTVPINTKEQNYNNNTYPPNPYPIVRINLKTPVPFGELVSAVIFNRTGSPSSSGRIGKDRVVLKGAKGEVVSNVQLPASSSNAYPPYIRVDYKPVVKFDKHTTTELTQVDSKIINVPNLTQVNKGY